MMRQGLEDYFNFYNYQRPHQALSGRTPEQLNGRLAAQQNAIGNLNEPPLLVGDVHKAQQVYQQGQETSKVQRQLE